MSWFAEGSKESMDGGSGWDTTLYGPFRTKADALHAPGVSDGEVEYHNGKAEHRFCVSVFQAQTRAEALAVRELPAEWL